VNLGSNDSMLLAIVVAVLVCLGLILGSRRKVRYCRGRFLSKNEKEFLGELDRVVGSRYRVFAQVRLGDLVSVEMGGSRRSRWKALSQVFGKSVDFVLCNRLTLEPVLILEVDDRSHEAADRRGRDKLVDRVCAEAGLPLVRVKARFSYHDGELLRTLQAAGLSLTPSFNMKEG